MNAPPQIDYLQSATHWFGHQSRELDVAMRKVLTRASLRQTISDEPAQMDAGSSFGEALADKVAAFGGSWRFIILFGVILLTWVALNTGIIGSATFDPYPFIFLNLLLSMLAAMQAPVIMMSQNRQSAKDRQMAAYDYEVNLKAEVEIMALHEKMDALRSDQMMTLIAQQQTQIDLLTSMMQQRGSDATASTR